MDEINNESVEAQFLKVLIENINSNIKAINAAGLKIYYGDNFDYIIEHVRYSPAQDKLIVEFKEDNNQ